MVRLATYNLLHGVPVLGGAGLPEADPAGRPTGPPTVPDDVALRAAVASLDADVLALQEVDVDQPRSGSLHQARSAAEALGAAHWRFAPSVLGTPGVAGWQAATRSHESASRDSARVVRDPVTVDDGTAGHRTGGGPTAEDGTASGRTARDPGAGDRGAQDPAAEDGTASGRTARDPGAGDRGAQDPAAEEGIAAAPGPLYGVALVSRLPVLEWRTTRFDPAPWSLPLLVPAEPRPRFVKVADEPRAAIAAVLEGARGPFTVVTVHLSFVPGYNVGQLRRMRTWLAGLPRPLVLLGDLNLPGRLPARITGWPPLLRAPTYPVVRPRVQLDHVLADGLTPAQVAGARAEVRPLPVSDHAAVTADLDL